MARGDIKNDSYISVASGGTTNIQPGSGDEYAILTISTDIELTHIQGYDGTNATGDLTVGAFAGDTTLVTTIEDLGWRVIKMLATNSQYVRFRIGAGSTAHVLWSALETK